MERKASIHAGIRAFNWNDMQAVGELCTEDVEVYPFEGWPDDPVYCGRQGMMRLASDWWNGFDGSQMKAERVIETGDGVVALILQTGSHQGVLVEQRLGALFEFRGELWSRVRYFLGYDGALEAAGLSRVAPDATKEGTDGYEG